MLLSRKLILFTSFFLLPTSLWASRGNIQIKIRGLSCPFCVYGVEKKLKHVQGIESVATNYRRGIALLKKKAKAEVDIAALTKAVTDAGFTVDSINLIIKGTLTEWRDHPALKDPSSGEIFLLVEKGPSHDNEKLSSAKLNALKALGGKSMIVEGRAHGHVGMPTAIEVDRFRMVP